MKKELTLQSIVIGLAVSFVMTAANVYLGLYAGMTVSASIPAAVIALGIYKGILKREALYESNIVQTMASAGESLAAGIIFTLPALILVGIWKDFEFWPTTLIAISGGLLGVIFMIPLRAVLIKDEKELTYPEGVACAEVLKVSEQTSQEDAKKGPISVLKGLLVGGFFKLSSSYLGIIPASFEKAAFLSQRTFFFGFDVSAALMGVGYIVRMHVALLVLLGGIIGFFITLPLLRPSETLLSGDALNAAWTLWSSQIRYLGVGAMVVGGLFSIISVRRGIAQGLGTVFKKDISKNHEVDLSLLSIGTILMGSVAVMFGVYYYFLNSFGLTLLSTLVMLFCSFLFVTVSSYIVGLVGSSNNPVSGMTISALLAASAFFLAIGLHGNEAIFATLGIASIVCCAACTAGDCSQDLKTGDIIGATPRSQQLAQIIGVIFPAFIIAPILSLLHQAYGIGQGLKAPQAGLFASITKAIFAKGSIPYDMVLYGAILGVLIIIIDQTLLKQKSFRLHLMPIAVGIYLPVTIAVPMFFGALVHHLISGDKKKQKEVNSSQDQGVLFSSGLVAGEALTGVVLALFFYLGFQNLELFGHIFKDISAIVLTIGLIWYLKKMKEA